MKKIKVGDSVQWLINGSNQFLTPRKVVKIVSLDNSFYAYTEGASCAIPVEQLSKIETNFIKKCLNFIFKK